MTRLAVAYFREIIGYIDTDGPKGNWESANTPLARFLENSHPGELPNTFKYMQPEGWLAGFLRGETYVEEGIRFLSNLTVIPEGAFSLDKVGIDTLHTQLKDGGIKDGTFTGLYAGPSAPGFTPDFETRLAGLWDHELTPKFSGAQVKIPVSLLPDLDGGQVILPAVHSTFSHILKVPREGYYESLPAVEWMGLEIARRAGLDTADAALVQMPEGMAPALLIERFDIPHVDDDLTKLTRIADFCNVTDRPPQQFKYGTDVSVCFTALEKQSSNPEADREALFKRIILAHYMLDYDMHLKNISVLKTFDRDTHDVHIRFAPVYDAMTTAIYPELGERGSALNYDPQPEHGGLYSQSINNRYDLMKIAELNGISHDEANRIIDHIAQNVADAAVDIARNPPEILKDFPACLLALRCAATEIVWNSDAPNVPEWRDDEVAVPDDYAAIAKNKKNSTTAYAFNGTRNTPGSRFEL